MKIVIICLFLNGCWEPFVPHKCDNLPAKVKTIGGCDRHARCGVLLDDGTQLTSVESPVVGGVARGRYCEVVK